MAARKRRFLIFLGISLLLTTSFFWMGFTMGELNYKQNIVEALKSHNPAEAVRQCYEWQQNGSALKSPLFFLTKAIVHLKNGNTEAAMHNLERIIDLLE